MKVFIDIHTDRQGLAVTFPAAAEGEELDFEELMEAAEEPEENDVSDFFMEGDLIFKDGRVELTYEESELSGMEGSTTVIGFHPETPELVSMIRGGAVSTALVFEPNKRHLCVYDTPISSFQVCVATVKVKNDLLQTGKLELDYLIEIHGAKMEHCKMGIQIRAQG